MMTIVIHTDIDCYGGSNNDFDNDNDSNDDGFDILMIRIYDLKSLAF